MWAEAARPCPFNHLRSLCSIVKGLHATYTDTAWIIMRRHIWWYGEAGIAPWRSRAVDMALLGHRRKGRGANRSTTFLGGLKHDRPARQRLRHVNKAGIALQWPGRKFFGGRLSAPRNWARNKGLSNIGGRSDVDSVFFKALERDLGGRREDPDRHRQRLALGRGHRTLGRRTALAQHRIGCVREPLYVTE